MRRRSSQTCMCCLQHKECAAHGLFGSHFAHLDHKPLYPEASRHCVSPSVHGCWHPPLVSSHTAGAIHEPHEPPHPSAPHSRPEQLGKQQTPELHTCVGPGHSPHEPPHPSSPQSLPAHCEMQPRTHVPDPTSHSKGDAQAPQEPPHPSLPHVLSSQARLQQMPLAHSRNASQSSAAEHIAPKPPSFGAGSSHATATSRTTPHRA